MGSELKWLRPTSCLLPWPLILKGMSEVKKPSWPLTELSTAYVRNAEAARTVTASTSARTVTLDLVLRPGLILRRYRGSGCTTDAVGIQP